MSKPQKHIDTIWIGALSFVAILVLMTVAGLTWYMQNGKSSVTWTTQRTSSGITYELPSGSGIPDEKLNGDSKETWVDLPDEFRLVIKEDISEYDKEFYEKINAELRIDAPDIGYDRRQDHLYLLNASDSSLLLPINNDRKAVVYIWNDISKTLSTPNNGAVGMGNPVGPIDMNDPNMPMLKTTLRSFKFPGN
jgi:hypothetical protein